MFCTEKHEIKLQWLLKFYPHSKAAKTDSSNVCFFYQDVNTKNVYTTEISEFL